MSRSSRRRKLYEQQPNCHWCGKPTVYSRMTSGGDAGPDEATIDHIYSRRDPRRASNPGAFVIAHSKCNEKRAEIENKASDKLWMAMMPLMFGDSIVTMDPLDMDAAIDHLLEKLEIRN